MQSHLPPTTRFADRFHHWAFRHGYPALLRIAPHGPRGWFPFGASVVAFLIFVVYQRPKRLIRRNLARILGLRAGSWRVRRCAAAMLRHFVLYHGDLFRFAQLPAAEGRALLDRVEGMEHLERAVAAGAGGVLLTAHFGNYELGGVLLGQRQLPVSVVYVKDKYEQAERYRSLLRGEGAVEEIAIEPRASWSSLPVLRALRAGRLVAMQGDRDLDGRGVPAPFFGVTVRFPRGPFLVALLTGAPIIPTFVSYTPAYRFVSRMYPPIAITSSGDRERDLGAAAASWAAVLEAEVRRCPEQWYTFYDYFATHRVEPEAVAAPTPARRRASA